MDNPTPTTQPYTSAILLATFSLIAALLITPPMLWHGSNRNIGATSLILWLLILNFQTFINALIWPHDDISQWYSGNVLCDIEVKTMIAAQIGVPASVASVLRVLARVMDTDKVGLGLSKAQKRKDLAVDLLWCVGFPLLQMFSHYVVQTERYYVIGIAGCTPAASSSWVTDLLIFAPPVAWTLLGGWYSALVLTRLHRYRRNFTSLLAHSNTNRSRFVRLFGICLVWLCISVPLQIYVVSQQAAVKHLQFDWNLVHDPEAWRTIEKAASGGRIPYPQYIWLGSAFMVFVFFGFGRDATRMYAKGLRGLGLGRCLPFLNNHHTPPGRTASHAGTMNSVSSKARLLFGRKSSTSPSQSVQSVKSWATDYTMAEPLSPRTMKHLETVQENSRMQTPTPASAGAGASKSRFAFWRGQHAAADVEKALPVAPKDVHSRSGFQRLTSPFRPAAVWEREQLEALPMDDMKTHVTVKSTVAAGPVSPKSRFAADQGGVLVRKDIRQGSEVAVNDL